MRATAIALAIVLYWLVAVWAAPQTGGPGSSATIGSIRIDAVAVPLNPLDPSQAAIGDFAYAGGLQLTSTQTDRLHGLSDIILTGGNRLTAVGDEGILVDLRLVLDRRGRLARVTGGRLAPLTGENGEVLVDKEDADSEGLARLPNGDRLVAFERRHRVWLYPAAGGRPRAAPSPQEKFPSNGGMEALGADPEAGADAYVVGAEISGETWTCRVRLQACIKGPTIDKPEEFGLVALNRLPGMQTAYLLRAFDPVRGNRITLVIFRGTAEVGRMEMAPPMTIDNFEGLASVRRPDGRIRFYLMSDDNVSNSQRTLLLAFDWKPPVAAPPATGRTTRVSTTQ